MNIIEKLERLHKYEHGKFGMKHTLNGEYVSIADLLAIIEEYKKQEPVAWMDPDGEAYTYKTHDDSTPLFTHPPLSDETVKDAAIGKLVREKMQSGNDVPVSRCTITRAEFEEAMKAES